MIDYLIVGAGLYGATFAQQAIKDGKTCLVIDKRNHIGGNCYTEKTPEGIHLHSYGPHIFHTNNENIWLYVNQFCKFNNFINRPKVNFNGKIFSFPINLFTLYQLFGVQTPEEAKLHLDKVKVNIKNPSNLEEWILSQVGEEIYYTFIYGYTKKQWGREPKELPSFIIKRLPIRLSFNDNYFTDSYQGIPCDGYTSMITNMLDGASIELETNYINNRSYYDRLAKTIIYTGPIDEFFDFSFGYLDYRSLKFDTQKHNIDDFQGNAIVNYTNANIEYTRIVEHKHFMTSNENISPTNTYITKEYPSTFNKNHNQERFYPINDDINNELYAKYTKILKTLGNKYIFGGRLAEYKYFDMHQIIGSALNKYKKL